MKYTGPERQSRMIPRWHNLIIAIGCFLIAGFLFLLMGCTHSWQGVCRHKALFANFVVGEYYPVYTIIGTTKSGERHAQSILFLEVKGSTVFVGGMEFELKNITISDSAEFSEYMGSLGRVRVVPD